MFEKPKDVLAETKFWESTSACIGERWLEMAHEMVNLGRELLLLDNWFPEACELL